MEQPSRKLNVQLNGSVAEVLKWLMNQGVAIGVLLWFMLRMESKVDAIHDLLLKLLAAPK